jgi:hypothetical protein
MNSHFSGFSRPPSYREGKVQEEELDSCRAAGERGPATGRDEGPGETEGVSPGAIWAAFKRQSGPGRIRGQSR